MKGHKDRDKTIIVVNQIYWLGADPGTIKCSSQREFIFTASAKLGCCDCSVQHACRCGHQRFMLWWLNNYIFERHFVSFTSFDSNSFHSTVIQCIKSWSGDIMHHYLPFCIVSQSAVRKWFHRRKLWCQRSPNIHHPCILSPYLLPSTSLHDRSFWSCNWNSVL